MYVEGQESSDLDPMGSYVDVNYLDWDRFHIIFENES